jgi:hypothetical protein
MAVIKKARFTTKQGFKTENSIARKCQLTITAELRWQRRRMIHDRYGSESNNHLQTRKSGGKWLE